MSSERFTIFDRNDSKFTKAVEGFGLSVSPAVLSDIDDFEFDWLNGMAALDLRRRYDYKEPKYKRRPDYKLFQIRVGPNRKHLSYRATVIFYDNQISAAWVHAFKKENDNEPQEILLAVARADDYWEKIVRQRRKRS